MRISDWSSDVCSSDLLASSTQRPSRPFARLTSLPWLGGQRKRRHHAFAGFGVADRRLSFLLHFLHAHDALHRQVQGAGVAELDRKSVVSGKSVSVRVDLGGRRINKKKIQT